MSIRNIVVSIVITVLLLILSLLFLLGNQDTDSIIVNISAVLSCLCSVATFIIALLLFKKFGIDNTIIENKALTVFKLIDLIKSKSFVLHGHPEFQEIWINFHHFEVRKSSYSTINVVLLVSESYYKSVEEIIMLANSVFTPIEIGMAIKGIELHMLGRYQEDDGILYCKLTPHRKDGMIVNPDVSSSEVENWGTFNMQNLTLSEFLNRWDTVIDMINQWLKENTDGQTLNINPLPDRK